TLIFMPVALRLAQHFGSSPSRLMMPLSFAAVTSGMMTLIGTTPNLVVNATLQNHGLQGFDFFDITPFGLAAMVIGTVYMLFAKRWLSNDTGNDHVSFTPPSFFSWLGDYELSGRTFRL